ncbi:MAG TPA: hypothetical protein VNZ22_06555, partial [Bacillota bacterium]|nr:hypothetical protein [Bacillota bacterium]
MMRQHRATVLGVLVATFLVGIILWSLLTPSTDARLATMRQKGFPVTLAELDAWYRPVTNGENAALIYTRAFALPFFAHSADSSFPSDDKFWLPARGQALTEQEKKAITAILADNQGVV